MDEVLRGLLCSALRIRPNHPGGIANICLWQFRGQIGKFENLKMAVPLVAILAPETSYYLVVVYIELPFHSLCKQFTIITVVFIGLLVQKAKFLLYHGNQHQNPSNHLEDIGTMQSSKPVLKT